MFDSNADWLHDYSNGFRIPSQHGFGIEVFNFNSLTPDRQDSNWYEGKIAKVTNTRENPTNTISIEAVGEIKLTYYPDTNDKTNYETHFSFDELNPNRFTNDKSVHQAINEGRIELIHNNWYECYDDLLDTYCEQAHSDLDEALLCATETLSAKAYTELLDNHIDKQLWEA
jgi:hypothetical protein